MQPEGAPWFDATANSGRALEAIVWLYEATDEPLALDLAARIADHHLRDTVHADGAPRREILDPNNVGHNHSYLGALRGLLLRHELRGDTRAFDCARRTADLLVRRFLHGAERLHPTGAHGMNPLVS